MIDKASGFWFWLCFLLFRDLVSGDSLDFLSGHVCGVHPKHTQPLESLARWVYLSLCRFTLCAITSLSDAAMLPAICLQFRVSHSLCFLFHSGATASGVGMHTSTQWHLHRDRHTLTEYIRNHGRRLVTSWANLWLLHCQTRNENQCPWLRELAALLNSEMTPVSGLHWVLH